MTEKLRQSLSAAIDDEADAFELRRVLDELNRDPDLRAVWDRYHLIGSALRGEHRAVRPGLRDRVWQVLDGSTGEFQAAAVAQEPAADQPPADIPVATPSRRRISPYVGLAAAATIALAVVFGTGVIGPDADSPVPALAGADIGGLPAVASSAPAGALIPENAAISTLSGPEVSASDLQRAHAYMLHHTQQQGMNQSSVMSLVKLATYEAP
jgi:sigma-E factor negative regulatory protein RseA